MGILDAPGITRAAADQRYVPATLPSYAPATLTKGAYNAALNAYNLKTTNTRKWAKALAKARVGTGLARLNFFGDSLTMGGTLSPSFSNAYPTRVRQLMANLVGASVYDGVVLTFGKPGSGTAGSRDSTDTRVVYPSAAVAASGESLFGYSNRLPVGAGDMTFTPVDSCDGFTVYYLVSPGNATFDIWADSGTHTTTSAAGTAAIAKVSISAGSLGAHVLHIGNITGSGSVAIVAVEATAGTTGVRVSRLGVGGQRWQDINNTTSAVTSSAVLTYLAGDLNGVALGANDFIQQTDLTTVETNARTCLQNLLGVSDTFLIVTPPLSNTLTIPYSSYAGIAWKLAEELDIPLIDLNQRWGSYAAMSTFYNDNVHPKPEGHWDMASGVWRAVASIS